MYLIIVWKILYFYEQSETCDLDFVTRPKLYVPPSRYTAIRKHIYREFHILMNVKEIPSQLGFQNISCIQLL